MISDAVHAHFNATVSKPGVRSNNMKGSHEALIRDF